jgi:SPP1 gp7 family putative phage head morphogenesis protein
MAFQARKTRERKRPDPVGQGKPLTPSAPIRIWYQNQMWSVVKPMLEDYRTTIKAALEDPEVARFYAMDDTSTILQRTLNALNKKWSDIFRGFAAQLSPKFVAKVDAQSKSSTWYSLSAAGVEQPRQAYTESVANTLQSSVDFNHTLITKIQEDVHEELYNSIMLSLTSPNPEEQGMSGIQNALNKVGITSKKRVDLIARDQNSKVYTSLATERMRQNGVEYFEWMHSSAGKVPRQTHVDKDGMVFQVDDPRLWTGPKADQGPPGWAINCRCRMKPLIGYNPEDDE